MSDTVEHPPRINVRISGPLACFSRPEFAVERTSYPWITPSAARGALEAVLWKPRIRYEVREIRVLAPIRYIGLRRNEIGTKIPVRGLGPESRIDVADERQQRNTMALQDVDYVVGFDLRMNSAVRSSGPDDNHGKYLAMLLRRLERGQRFHAPYLGCREFAADVRLGTGDEAPLPISMEHGWMLYDFLYPAKRSKKAKPRPLYFDARLVDGVVQVPPRSEVLERLPEAVR